MLVKNTLATLLGLAVVAEAASLHQFQSPALMRRQNRGGNRGGQNNGGQNNAGQNNGGQNNAGQNNGGQNNAGQNNGGQNNAGQGNNAGGDQASVTCLAANAVQTGSQQTGQNGEIAAGQVESKTDPANFINFCSGKTLTNGEQNRGGSCNGVVMGEIPSVDNMVSTVILNPKNLDDLAEGQTFTIQLSVANMNLGSFTNAVNTYYTGPQEVAGGKITGHTHVTVQDTGNSLNPTQPLDAKQFVFFKGINDAGNGQGLLSTDVTGGLPKGNYRLCTMSSASNHQPVLMPVAQRGSQEDCVRFTVGQGNGAGGNAGGNAGQGNAGGNAGQGNAGGNAGQGNAGGNAGQGNAGGNAGQGNAGGNAGQGNAGGNAGQGNAGGNAGQGNAGGNAGQGNAGGNAGQGNAGGNAGQGNAGQGGQGNAGGQGGGGQGKGKGNANAGGNAGANAGANAGGNAGANAGGNAGANAGGNAGANAGGNGGGQGQNANAGGALAGAAAPAVTQTGNADRPFAVNGATFANEAAAKQRACAIQNNACADAVNSGKAAGVTVQQCNEQEQACRGAA